VRALPILFACTLLAQSPHFEVASIKPTNPAGDLSVSGIETKRGLLRANNVTLKRCILGAYGVRPHQVVGGPDWINSDAFDIVAKADEPVGDAILSKMMQTLLAERFKLTLHRETRSMQAFVLDAPHGVDKLTKADGGEGNTFSGHGSLEIQNQSLDDLARILSRQMDLPVMNLTKIEGVFNLKLKWTPDGDKQSPDAPPSIYTAIQEQLGLRLRSMKTPIEVLVIDHAEKPSEN
jgi:uncharacterized protein (TIGR03435 family)